MKQSFNHHFHTFDSGLRLVTIPMQATKTATVFVLVGTGSKYETKKINGISHFLEHMMFKGTEKRPGTLDIARELDSLGASYNAFTSKEYTGYYAKASAEKLDIITDVVFDIFLNSKLSAEEIKIEKGVIVEEINMYYDLPQNHVAILFEKLLYGDQPAGWSIAGEKEIVTALEREDFVSYFDKHYVAENTIVAVAGNVDQNKVKERVDSYFKNIRHGKSLGKPKVLEVQTKLETLIHYKKTDQTHFILGFRSFDMFDDKKYALSVLAKVLGGGMSSRLFSEVRERRGLAYYIGASTEQYTDTGFLSVDAGVNNEKVFDAIGVVIDEIKKIKSQGITAKELQQAKDSVEGRLAMSLEHSDGVAMSYADSVLFHNKVLTPEEELDKIKRVTLEDVHNVAKEVFDNNKLNLALIGPFQEKEPFEKILKF
ncbi:MAG: pitrilysin family protein [bacterium]|nr:pitrilysin family protein [bacterium]